MSKCKIIWAVLISFALINLIMYMIKGSDTNLICGSVFLSSAYLSLLFDDNK